MKCLKREKIRAFIDNELSAREKKRVENHLSGCSKCQKELKKAEEEIQFIQRQLEFLNPKTVPEYTPLLFSKKEKRGELRILFKRFIFSSVRVPAILLVVIISLALLMSFMLFAKNVSTIPPGYSQSPEAKKSTLNFVTDDFIQSISLDIDLRKFKPIKNPRIFVLKEVE